jgi:thiaminase/transcriptional activator TenA
MDRQLFSDHLWELAEPVWNAIKRHPFLEQLEAGTLPIQKFRYYIVQDYHYLGGFGRSAAAALSAAPDTGTARRLLRRVTTPVERPLHGRLFDALGVTADEISGSLPAPTNLAYQNHMEVAMRVDGMACGVAALLPCPRIYHEVGKILSEPEHPVFRIWQSTYSEGLLEESTRAWSELLDDLADAADPDLRDRMTAAYLTSAQYEHMFWTMAYNLEEWPAGDIE